MQRAQEFTRFLIGWSAVCLLNELLNGYAGPTASLVPRSAALGALLLFATVAHGVRLRSSEKSMLRGSTASLACQPVYAALFFGIGLPSTAWRLANPQNAMALISMRRGATICFVFGIFSLFAVRLLRSARMRSDLI